MIYKPNIEKKNKIKAIVYSYNCAYCGKPNTRKVCQSQTKPKFCPRNKRGEEWHNCMAMLYRENGRSGV